MISRRFLIGTMAAIPVVGMLGPIPRAFAAGIGERPGDMAIGDPDAPVTVIEFFSLTCPACRHFHKNVFNRLKPEYVDTGKVRFVARDFPLNAPAFQAAVLAHCAGPARYFAFVDVLFETFDDWAGKSDYPETLAQIGELGGVSRDRYAACLADKDLEDAIFGGMGAAQNEYDVSGTPTLVINGERYEGSERYEPLAEHIDRLLSGS